MLNDVLLLLIVTGPVTSREVAAPVSLIESLKVMAEASITTDGAEPKSIELL